MSEYRYVLYRCNKCGKPLAPLEECGCRIERGGEEYTTDTVAKEQMQRDAHRDAKALIGSGEGNSLMRYGQYNLAAAYLDLEEQLAAEKRAGLASDERYLAASERAERAEAIALTYNQIGLSRVSLESQLSAERQAHEATSKSGAEAVTLLLSRAERAEASLKCVGIHTCHDECQNPVCLVRKRVELAEIEYYALRKTAQQFESQLIESQAQAAGMMEALEGWENLPCHHSCAKCLGEHLSAQNRAVNALSSSAGKAVLEVVREARKHLEAGCIEQSPDRPLSVAFDALDSLKKV